CSKRLMHTVYNWCDHLYKNNIYVMGYCIMPNHVPVAVYFPRMPKSLTTIMCNAKRCMAYEIIKRREQKKDNHLPDLLHSGVKKREAKKGQIHKVFEDSFDAKKCYSEAFIFQEWHYVHHNPVRKKWNPVREVTNYEHACAAFYETGEKK
ncbi:MAG TPA: hypothetical protein VEV15_09475, partial [Flavisolibacter sp.]|nr:hypothetical protein [Flavisolibacter sp.]